MANKKAKIQRRQRRIFAESIRKQVVKDIENGRASVSECCRELSVSTATIYKWLNRYSRYLLKGKTMVVEEQSEAYKSKQLQERIKELEAALGRKQIELDLLNKIIELAGEEYHEDLKKNFSDKPSAGSKFTKKSNTDTR